MYREHNGGQGTSEVSQNDLSPTSQAISRMGRMHGARSIWDQKQDEGPSNAFLPSIEEARQVSFCIVCIRHSKLLLYSCKKDSFHRRIVIPASKLQDIRFFDRTTCRTSLHSTICLGNSHLLLHNLNGQYGKKPIQEIMHKAFAQMKSLICGFVKARPGQKSQLTYCGTTAHTYPL